MFVGTNRIRVKKGTGGLLEERFAERRGVERQPGFLGFEMWNLESNDDDAEEYLIVTRWESREAQRAWTRGDAFREARAGPRADFIIGHARFSGYDVRLASAPAGGETAAGQVE